MKSGVELIADERKRQIEVEGWSLQHDLRHREGSLAAAAACYIDSRSAYVDTNWPFDDEWWKPKDRLSNLVRAGALIAAEIDRVLAARLSLQHGVLSHE